MSITCHALSIFVFTAVERGCPHNRAVEEENIALMDPEHPTEDKIRTFKDELKTKYSNTWEQVCPLPYDKAISYPINKIFIEGEIEHLEQVVDEKFGKFYIWRKLDSHNDFLKELWQRQIQIVLEGEPGFGKTTLGYQFAFDWAKKSEQSPLKDIDIYILLRLRYLKDVSSIPSAIKRFLLPVNSSLTVQDVKSILYYSSSVVIFLDGFNRFSYDKDSQLFFMKDIRTNNINSRCQVILTTKPFCIPDEYVNDMNRMRLTGFGEESWRRYLRKSVVDDDSVEEERIMKILHDNPLLRYLCQVPLFFVLFAHITKKHGNFTGDFSTVSAFFQTVIDRFHEKISSDINVNEHSALSSVCFYGLLKEEKGLIWKKGEICRTLSQPLYNEYLRVGLIVEKEFCRHRVRSEQRSSGSVIYETKVRFFHDVFCEWYAAKKLAKIFKTASQKECKQYFEKINPLDHQYVYRFACASDSEAASKIIKHMQGMKDGEKFAILCILEQSGDFKNVDETIENICSSPVIITNYDNLFLQRSTVQVLQYASDKNINIECVWLAKTNSTFDDDKASLEMNSGICLPKLASLRQLAVHDPNRKISKEDVLGFLKYVCLCDSLKDLRFQACLLPFLQREDLASMRNIIDEKPIDVQWEIPVHERNWYKLDIQSGKWLHNGNAMSKEKYDQVAHSFGVSFRTGHGRNASAENPDEGASSSV